MSKNTKASFRFSLAGLFMAVTMFAAGIGVGWWMRGATWQDELNAAADRLASRTRGVCAVAGDGNLDESTRSDSRSS